jgi:hypothetical protein
MLANDQKSVSDRPGNRGMAAIDVQLLHDVGDMHCHRAAAEVRRVGISAVRHAAGDERQRIALARRQGGCPVTSCDSALGRAVRRPIV